MSPRKRGKDGRHEEFSWHKLCLVFAKLVINASLPTIAIDKLMDSIAAELYKVGRSEIPSSYIGDLVMVGLKKLNHIAYIRFANVYPAFADIGDLKQELDSLAVRRELTPAHQLPLPPPGTVNFLVGRKRRSKCPKPVGKRTKSLI